jgi:hypothetical protein
MSDPSKSEEPTEPEDQAGSVLQDEIESFVEGAAGLFDSLKDIFVKSREEVVRGARLGKVRLDVYQLRKDREQLLQRLGVAAYELLVAGSLAHPDLAGVFHELGDLDVRIAAGEAEISDLAPAEEEAEPVEPSVVDVEAVVEPEPPDVPDVPEELVDAAIEAPVAEAKPEAKPKPKPKRSRKSTRAPAASKKKPARAPKKSDEK